MEKTIVLPQSSDSIVSYFTGHVHMMFSVRHQKLNCSFFLAHEIYSDALRIVPALTTLYVLLYWHKAVIISVFSLLMSLSVYNLRIAVSTVAIESDIGDHYNKNCMAFPQSENVLFVLFYLKHFAFLKFNFIIS